MFPSRSICDSRISIHAPREGCDYQPARLPDWDVISIHAPREGCDNRLIWWPSV